LRVTFISRVQPLTVATVIERDTTSVRLPREVSAPKGRPEPAFRWVSVFLHRWVSVFFFCILLSVFFFDGQTGKATGAAPTSWRKVLAAVAVGIVLVVITALVVSALAR
jgi:hypothetical protein